MKKTFLKTVSVLTTICLLLGTAAFAAPVTSGGGGTEYSYYWCQDFNDLPETASTAKAMRASNVTLARETVDQAKGDYAMKLTATAANGLGIIDNNVADAVVGPLPKFDFSKGPLVLSYDVTLAALNKAVFYLNLQSSVTKTDLFTAIRIEKSGRVMGFLKKDSVETEYATKSTDLSQIGSNTVAKAGQKYHIQNALIYDNKNDILTVKYYLDGEPMMKQNTTDTPLEFKYKLEDKMKEVFSGDMLLRFSLAGGTSPFGASATIDNITVRSEGAIDMSGDSYIAHGASSAAVTFMDTAEFDPENSPSSYPKAVNSIPASQTVLSGDNDYYTLTKYNAADNPLLLKSGEPAESKVGWKGDAGMAVSGLDIANDNEFYILKLKSPSPITSFAGAEPENQYTCLRRTALGTGTIVARETTILDENEQPISLENGKLPTMAKAIRFVTSPRSTLTEDEVKMEGADGKVFQGSSSGDNIWTISIDEELTEGTEYTVTLGDFSQTVTTTGDAPIDPNAFYWYEGFDNYDGETLPSGFNEPANKNIVLSKDERDGNTALKYTNNVESGIPNFTVTDTKPLDFSKGALLLSYDMTPQSALGWIEGNSNLLVPTLKIGSTAISQLSIIEYGGIKAAYYSGEWKRSGYIDSWPNNSLAKDTPVKFQMLLEKEGNQITATQYIDGKPVYYTVSDEERLAAITVDVTDEELANGWSLTFGGRRFPNGLLFDDFYITTVDGVTANDTIVLGNNTITGEIKLENTLQFANGAHELVKELKMDNTAAAADFRIKKYNITTDPLLLKGETVSGFELNKAGDSLVFSKLPERSEGEIITVELSDSSKIKTLAGKNIDTTVFKLGAAENLSGIKKTVITDAEGDVIPAGAGGVVPSEAGSLTMIFTKDFEPESTPVITGENGYSVTAVQNAAGAYVFDFTQEGKTLSPNKTYAFSCGNVSAEFKAGAGTVKASVLEIDASGKASVVVTNTMEENADMYIISAYFDGEDLLTSNLMYEKFTVTAGTTQTLTMSAAHTAPEVWSEQKIFVWNDFQTMLPYCKYGSRTNNTGN